MKPTDPRLCTCVCGCRVPLFLAETKLCTVCRRQIGLGKAHKREDAESREHRERRKAKA